MKRSLVLIISLFIGFISFAEDAKDHSTIYVYRTNGFAGAICGLRVKIGNQEGFNLSTGDVAEYTIYSTGIIKIDGDVYACQGTKSGQVSLKVERGKKYYVKVGINLSNLVEIQDENDAKRFLNNATARKYEEDKNAPINKTALEDDDNMHKGQGTCFLISDKGYFITNFHCVDKAKDLTIKGIDGDFTTKYGATVVASDPSNDLALVKVGNKNVKFSMPPFAIRDEGVQQAERVYALGFPVAEAMGAEVKITEGIISAKSGVLGDISKFQISAAVNHGNSGGPLIDEQGNMIGVIYAKSTVADNAGYAVKASYLKLFLKNVDGFEYPALINTVKDKTLADKVAEIRKCIFIIESN